MAALARARESGARRAQPAAHPVGGAAPAERESRGGKERRLSYRESKELEALPDRIDELERERTRLYESLADPELLRDGAAVVEVRARLASLDAELSASMERWEKLATLEAG